ncbi:ABC transporter permease [Sulfuriroseicoccus oceanibius]|uniref:Iron ABC transporter permease n=1 Tax=Sulfuriroseicoccus oceanibius TaxID=2707525 RepID=A0A7T7EZ36_9BACT|nr:iron ABC transporter permease [Sulfuriroseicoccus oceanibius]QQL43815.1 iron ABC transporter permease [Sulfuriroseicoccus oceanibius]
MSKRLSSAVFLITILFMVVFLAVPIFSTVSQAFVTPEGTFTLANVFEVFLNPIYREGLVNAFLIAVASLLACLAIALPLAVIHDRFEFPAKRLLSSLVLVPMILPPFVGAIGVKQILGTHGALNALLANFGLMDELAPYDWLGSSRFLGVVLMNALHLYPILYLNIVAALANLDPAMEEAAQNLGSNWWSRFRRITLPLTLPGIFAGGTVVFIWAFTELGVPLIFDYTRVTPVQIFDGIKDINDNPFPFALVVVMLVLSSLFFVVGRFKFGRATALGNARITRASSAQRLPLGPGLACTALFAGTTAIAVIPHIGVGLLSIAGDWYQSVLPQSFTLAHYDAALSNDLVVPSIKNSLRYASAATLIDIVLGIAIAYIVVRTNIKGRHLLDTLAMLPLAVPGLVLAFGYLAMTREGAFFSFLRYDGDPTLILIIAYATRRLPYVVRSAAAGFQQTSVELEEAARSLGVSPSRALRKITLPLITANLIAGALLAFSFAMLEVSDSLILAQQAEHYPITMAIYQLFGVLGNGHYLASALGVWSMLFLTITIAGASIILGRRIGALFRV